MHGGSEGVRCSMIVSQRLLGPLDPGLRAEAPKDGQRLLDQRPASLRVASPELQRPEEECEQQYTEKPDLLA